MIKIYVLLMTIVLIITSCNSNHVSSSTNIETEIKKEEITFKELISTQNSSKGVIAFYETEKGLNSAFFSKKEEKLSLELKDGTLERPNEANINVSYIESNRGSEDHFKMFYGTTNRKNIERVTVKYSDGGNIQINDANIIKTNKDYIIWYVIPDKLSKYHLEKIEIKGYLSDGKEITF
ncbi:hypothetical protein [Paenibacillus doosanensis]|uniref:hypothetical protein n=1 Tax=Paenibacillus doosanensis TaxID=1229154 RepID=UPI00218000CA|nr:hypothetical protein [Paenibacillus doosanensis]